MTFELIDLSSCSDLQNRDDDAEVLPSLGACWDQNELTATMTLDGPAWVLQIQSEILFLDQKSLGQGFVS